MSDVLANSPEARTETGEIKDQTQTPTETKTEQTQSTTDPATTKATETQKPADGDAKKPDTAQVPEKYEFPAPEGYELDEKLVEKASGIFKELGLSQEAATKLVSLYNEQAIEALKGPNEKYQEIRTGWRNDVVADPELGNGKDGLKDEVKATLGRAIDSMGPKLAGEFRQTMDLLGAGDHPAILRGLLTLAKQATEGRPVKPGGVSPAAAGAERPETGAKALYPNLP